MTNKIAGLYVQLAKTLNALELAGEDIAVSGLLKEVEGDSGVVRYHPGRGEPWAVEQA